MEQPNYEIISCDEVIEFIEDGSQVAEAPPATVPVLTAEEQVFADAIRRYQNEHRRALLSWRDIFEIVQALGYRKMTPPGSNGDPQGNRSP